MKASQLRAIARQRIAGNAGTLICATLIYFAILFAVFFVIIFVYSAHLISTGAFSTPEAVEQYAENLTDSSSMIPFAIDMVSLVVGALLQTLNAGLLYLCLNAARLKEIKISDLFFAYKRNPDRVILIALIQSGAGYLCMLVPTLIGRFSNSDNIVVSIVYFASSIVFSILQTIVMILFSQSMFLYIDNPDESVMNCIRVSVMIMKKNIWRYFCLSFSFIGWFLLAMISCGAALLYVIPYMHMAFALFYMHLKGKLGSSVDVTIS